MANEEEEEETTEYHLHRYFHGRKPDPYQYAATVIEDAGTTEGYKVVDHDPDVADSAFFEHVHRYLQQPVTAADSDYKNGAVYEILQIVNPGDPNHFHTAIREIPRTPVRSSGRSQK